MSAAGVSDDVSKLYSLLAGEQAAPNSRFLGAILFSGRCVGGSHVEGHQASRLKPCTGTLSQKTASVAAVGLASFSGFANEIVPSAPVQLPGNRSALPQNLPAQLLLS